MRLSKASMYAALALRHLLDIQSQAAHPVQARQVAEHLGIPTDSALKVLQSLSRGGLLQSTLGRRGGYRPSAEAADATLRRIVELMDGPIVAEVPAETQNPITQALWNVCNDVRDRTVQQLDAVRVVDLATGQAAIRQAQPGQDAKPEADATPADPATARLALAG
ncbi:MAG: Rrf2 family transcriptional regulator [Planctomycetota bacterium]